MTETEPAAKWPFTQIKPFLDYLSSECGLAANTITAYRRDLSRWGRYCREQDLTDPGALTPPILQHYARYLSQRRLATSSIARHLVSLRMFMRYHLLCGQVGRDVSSVLETPKTWQRLPSVLSRQSLSLTLAIRPARTAKELAQDAHLLRESSSPPSM